MNSFTYLKYSGTDLSSTEELLGLPYLLLHLYYREVHHNGEHFINTHFREAKCTFLSHLYNVSDNKYRPELAINFNTALKKYVQEMEIQDELNIEEKTKIEDLN
jgi:hypothetical protein